MKTPNSETDNSIFIKNEILAKSVARSRNSSMAKNVIVLTWKSTKLYTFEVDWLGDNMVPSKSMKSLLTNFQMTDEEKYFYDTVLK